VELTGPIDAVAFPVSIKLKSAYGTKNFQALTEVPNPTTGNTFLSGLSSKALFTATPARTAGTPSETPLSTEKESAPVSLTGCVDCAFPNPAAVSARTRVDKIRFAMFPAPLSRAFGPQHVK
jgi:hypothetical protein